MKKHTHFENPPRGNRALWAALCLALSLCLMLSGSVRAADAADMDDATDRIDQILEGMSPSEKVGQMFLAVCPADAREAAEKHQPGGYVLFARDFQKETPKSVRAKIDGYQRVSKIPMLIAVDEEGGTVTRVSRYKAFRAKKFPSPQAVYKAGGADAIRADAREKAKLLKALGVNVNLAPVADVPTRKSSFIHGRSFGTDPELTAKYVAAVVKESREAKMGAVLKHFPGYGDNGDTHTGIVRDDRPREAFERDLLPFRAGVEAGAPAILVSHNIIECLDAERPASLSESAYRLLRDELGFQGVAMTDDLAMGAITKAYGQAEAAIMAVEAGNDLLISREFKTGIKAVLGALESGRITQARLDESVRRILAWKVQLGLVE